MSDPRDLTAVEAHGGWVLCGLAAVLTRVLQAVPAADAESATGLAADVRRLAAIAPERRQSFWVSRRVFNREIADQLGVTVDYRQSGPLGAAFAARCAEVRAIATAGAGSGYPPGCSDATRLGDAANAGTDGGPIEAAS